MREAILTLVDAGLTERPKDDAWDVSDSLSASGECASQKGSDREVLAWRIERHGRNIIRLPAFGRKREEEWQDADREFFDVIKAGLRRSEV